MEKSPRRKKRSFSVEFKQEAVELANKIGNLKAANELEINESSIRIWRKKLDPTYQTLQSDEKNRPYSELEKELRKLQKENRYLKQINNVLKKSTAIFSSDHMENLK